MPGPILVFDKVSKQYANGVTALRGVTLEVQSGSFTVILGPSGAGKSTLLRLVNGLVEPSSGQVTVAGLPVVRKHYRAIRQRVGMIFQQFHLVGRLNVLTNVLTGRLASCPGWMSLFHLFPNDAVDQAGQALERVGLADKAWVRADQLSGGQQQRVAIARALVQEPQLILADEPIASLDPVTGGEIMRLLARVCRESGITVLMNLHQVEVAMEFADHLIGLRGGQVVFRGTPAELTANCRAAIYMPPSEGTTDHAMSLAHT